MKKYIVTGLVGLVVVTTGAYVMYNQWNLYLDFVPGGGVLTEWSDDIRSYLPAEADQVLYFDVSPEFLAWIDTLSQQTGDTAPLSQSLQEVDELIAAQYMTGDQAYSRLLVKGTNEFDISMLIDSAIVPVSEEFTSKQLADQLWIYGPASSLDYHQGWDGDDITMIPEVEGYLDTFGDEWANLGFFSRPVIYSPEAGPMVQQFADKLEWTFAMSYVSIEEKWWRMILEFEEGVVPSPMADFTPILSTYASSDSLLYLEVNNLLWLAGVDEQQFLSLVPLLIGQQYPAVSAMLSSEDYARLYELLTDNIGIVLTPSSSSLGVSLHILFADQAGFDLLGKLGPVWKQLAGSTVWAENLEEQVEEDRIAYQVEALPMFGGEGGESLLQIVREDAVTRLSLLGDLPSVANPISLSYDDQTVVTFLFDSTNVQQVMQNNPLMQMAESMETLVDDQQGIQAGTMIGDVQLHPEDDQIVVSFEIN